MSYQVIARKWRPQRFDDVVGQPVVTRTLRNALGSGRLAQAFVFAGPRGVGKTTTARILARALNCVKGPTPDPCGLCHACIEIADGRDIDVLEIDAATHTQVDNVREVILAGLAIAPVRNRFKVFIIDEVHQLSSASFNALLKSIEEPPPHVVFMMATTELDKIPDTVLSRSQVYEFRTISTKAIGEQLRRIADAERLTVGDDALQLIARDAEGSMRDAESKLDQVLAFTGEAVTLEDVATVLGLVGRDLLLEAVQAVADEDAAGAFAVAARAVEMGYDLRAVVRELSRTVRDLLVIGVDGSRIFDPEIAAEAEREPLLALAARFSREDLLRSFDLLTRAEHDIRVAAQPRYHLEMALLRWIYVRKLVAIEELLRTGGSGVSGAPARRPPATGGQGSSRASVSDVAPPVRSTPDAPAPSAFPRRTAPASGREPRGAGPAAASTLSTSVGPPPYAGAAAVGTPAGYPNAAAASGTPAGNSSSSADLPIGFKEALLGEVRRSKVVFHNTVIAQAQQIEVALDRVTFVFSPTQRALRDQLEQNRGWLEAIARQVAGRPIAVTAVQLEVEAAKGAEASDPVADKKSALREQALADAGVRAFLEVFPAEIRDVEEM